MLGQVLAQLLMQEPGVRARVGFAGHEPNHQALLAGDIDVYMDYLGTALRRYLGLQPRKTAAAYMLPRVASSQPGTTMGRFFSHAATIQEFFGSI